MTVNLTLGVDGAQSGTGIDTVASAADLLVGLAVSVDATLGLGHHRLGGLGRLDCAVKERVRVGVVLASAVRAVSDELALGADAAGAGAGVHAAQVHAGQVGGAVVVVVALRAAAVFAGWVALVVAGQARAQHLVVGVVHAAVGVLAARAGGAAKICKIYFIKVTFYH